MNLFVSCFSLIQNHYKNRTFDAFRIKNYKGTQGEDLSTVKVLSTPILFPLPTVLRRMSWCYSYFVWLGEFTTKRFVLRLRFAFVIVLVFVSVVLSIVITSVGEERADLSASSICVVYFVCVTCRHFVIPTCVMGWLRLMIVALPGLFIYDYSKIEK